MNYPNVGMPDETFILNNNNSAEVGPFRLDESNWALKAANSQGQMIYRWNFSNGLMMLTVNAF